MAITAAAAAATPATKTIGAALQLGGTNAVAQFLEYVNQVIRFGTKIEKSSQETDQILRELVQKANQQVGRSLAKVVPVVVSFAGPVKEDGKTGTPTNFQINGKNEAINLEDHLNSINPNGAKFQVEVLNDSNALINAAAINYKNLVELGDNIYEGIMGTGMGGSGGTIAKEGVTKINANEPGHEIMPYLSKFELIEGKDRQGMTSPVSKNTGYVELYTAGGNTNDRGLMATVKNLKAIAAPTNAQNITNTELRAWFTKRQQVVDLLNKTLAENGVKDSAIEVGDLYRSSIMSKDKEYSNKEITKAAKNGDVLAKALVNFTLIRASHALAQSIKSQGHNKPVALVSVTGSFNKGLRNAVDPNGDLQFRVLNTELKTLGHHGIKDNDPKRLVQFDPELDGTPLILEERLKAAV
jgi:hypothetical protein